MRLVIKNIAKGVEATERKEVVNEEKEEVIEIKSGIMRKNMLRKQ